MNRYYYQDTHSKRKAVRYFGLVFFLLGICGLFYVFFPLLSWNIYFAPAFASQNVTAPIPQTTVVNSDTIKSLFTESVNVLKGVDYTNAQNWFPSIKAKNSETKVDTYFLSIPKLKIKDAVVSTVDYDLGIHLINYGGTAIPPHNGNAVIFGHSTLPQLFNPKDYKTIFATAYTLEVGDTFQVKVEDIVYNYKIFNITVVDPSDTSVFAQTTDTSYVTIITCTPPGTTWRRLILKARLETL